MVGHKKFTLFDAINVILLAMIAISTFYPFLNLFFVSISSMDEVVKNSGLMLVPKSVNLEAYQYVLHYGGLGNAFKSTIIITVVGTLVNLVMTSIGAYVLSDKAMPGRNFLMTYVLITMLFSGGMIPSYIVVKNLGMIDHLTSLIVPGAISTFLLIVQRNFFQGIPASLKESARMDGASEVRILVRIMLPLSMPILATLALFYGVGHWNQYSAAIIYINNSRLYPLQVIIRNMFNTAIEDLKVESLPPPVETVRSATVMLATLPIICVYPFLQKYFVKGMMVGAIKG